MVADLADTSKLASVFSHYHIKTVLHFAASIIIPESVTDPLKYYTNNTCNTMNLLQACVNYGVEQFIFSSTAAVYGGFERRVAGEDSPTILLNPYGRSKLMSECILRDVAAAHGLRYVILRYFNVTGADPQIRMGSRNPKASHLIKACCQAALGMRKQVGIFGTDYDTPDGTGVRDYIHIEDLASAHLAALKYLDAGKQSITLNVGYSQGSSVKEVIEVVKKVSGVNFPVIEAPRRPGDPAMLIAKAERIKQELGWKPRYANLETIVADAWRWEQKLKQE